MREVSRQLHNTPPTHNMTVGEKFIDLIYRIEILSMCSFGFVVAFIKHGFTSRYVFCYPEKPRFFHVIYYILHVLGYRQTENPSKATLFICFEDVTVRKAEITHPHTNGKKIINAGCDNISKIYVEEIFSKVFGYGMKIDPTTHRGVCVRKSNDNATHDGVIITCPDKKEEGYIYQRLINNIEGTNSVDYRVVLMGGKIAYVLKRYKTLSDRFDKTIRAIPQKPSAVFNDKEIQKFSDFAHAFKLDYGDLDVLRDIDDHRIYIVDVNNTPQGPHPGGDVTRAEFRQFCKAATVAFKKSFLNEEK